MQNDLAKWIISGIVGLFLIWMETLSPESYQTMVVNAWVPIFKGTIFVVLAGTAWRFLLKLFAPQN